MEAYSDRPRIYSDPAVIRVGEPLVICEGEFDAMLLGQQLPEASVVTLGSAIRPDRPGRAHQDAVIPSLVRRS